MVGLEESIGEATALPLETSALFRSYYASKVQLLEALRRALTSGELRAGMRLPTERSVAEHTGLSRAAVRSVLDQLAAEGLLLRKVGRGTFAATGASKDTSCEQATPAELLALRTVIEPRLPDLIVLNASEQTLGEIRAFVHKGRASRDWQDCEAWDSGFHRLLFQATGNSLFRDLGERIAAERRCEAWLRLKQRDFSIENWNRYQSEHEQIIEALCNRDRVKTRNLLFKHLTGVQNRLLG